MIRSSSPSPRLSKCATLGLAVAMLGYGSIAQAALLGCVDATPPAASPARVPDAGEPIEFVFPAVGEGSAVSHETTRGRATALLFITTFDLASQLLSRRLGEVLTTFTPRANAAAVAIEPPLYAELLPAYRESLSLPYPVVMADYATQNGVGPFGSITRVPTLVVLDREGREVFRHEGPLERAEIEDALRRGAGPARR